MKNSYSLLILLFGCAPESAVVDSARLPQIECAPELPHGKYYMDFEIVDSTCGTMGTIEANVFRGIVAPQELAGCTLTHSTWDSTMCATQSYFACYDDYWTMYLGWDVIGNIEDRDRLEGRLYTEMVRVTGWSCEGSYSFKGLRKNEDR